MRLSSAIAHLEVLATFIDECPFPAWVRGADGEFLACNAAYEGHMGVTFAEIEGRGFVELYGAETAAIHRRRDLDVIEAEMAYVWVDPVGLVWKWPVFSGGQVECVAGMIFAPDRIDEMLSVLGGESSNEHVNQGFILVRKQ